MNDRRLARHEGSFRLLEYMPDRTDSSCAQPRPFDNGLPALSCRLFAIEHDDLIERLAARINTGDGGCQHLAVL